MQAAFREHIMQSGLFQKEDRLLLAISGGIDSCVLAQLLHAEGYCFDMAHCNFNLRGAESDGDEQHCRQLAEKYRCRIFTGNFDTLAHAETTGQNIQLAARELRYNMFSDLVKEHGYRFVLTAHHADDQIETFFINLLRGTGINGICGIKEKNNFTVRPLLSFTRQQIEAFAKEQSISYRTDSSNSEDKYRRNFIRHQVIPQLRTLNPDLENTMLRNFSNFRQTADIARAYFKRVDERCCNENEEALYIDLDLLKEERRYAAFLYHKLERYGFNSTQVNDLLKGLFDTGKTGKQFNAKGYKLTVERTHIVVRKPVTGQESIELPDVRSLRSFFKVAEPQDLENTTPHQLIISTSRIIFPLRLRSWRQGDYFIPFGMKGKKLLSDFFREQKMDSNEKEKALVLENGNGDIIWVTGKRSDERYRVSGGERDLLLIEYAEP
jgi:tRNA(Ile)-lysidine synthase